MNLYKQNVGGGNVKITGELEKKTIKTRIEDNKKVIIFSSILTLLSAVVTIFIPIAVIGVILGIVIFFVTTFICPPSRIKIIDKEKV